MANFIRRYPILSFVLICLIPVHGILWPALWLGASPDALKPLKLFFSLLPTAAAFIVSGAAGGHEAMHALWQQLFRAGTPTWYYLVAFAIFILVGFSALWLASLWTGILPSRTAFASWNQILLLSPVLLLFPGFAEEFGWRGFLQERLQRKMSVYMASMATGIIWGTWHTMDFLMGNWAGGFNMVLLFYAYIVGSSIVIGSLFTSAGGAIFVAMLAHFSANAASQFLPIWRNSQAGMAPIISFILLIWLTGILLESAAYVRRDPDASDNHSLSKASS